MLMIAAATCNIIVLVVNDTIAGKKYVWILPLSFLWYIIRNMKKIWFYILFLIVSLALNVIIAMFVPPVWAMCDCAYNSIKEFLILIGSPIVSLAFALFVHRRINKGTAYTDSFLLGIVASSLVMAAIGIANMIIFA